MKFWIFAHDTGPFDHWMDDHKRRFDAWHAAGVRGIVIGYMNFHLPDGSRVRAWTPDPEIYAAHGEPLPEGPTDPEREAQLQAMLNNAAERGWQIMIFGGPTQPAALQDQANSFPQASGFIVDGPGENHYELAFHHHGELLELRPGEDAAYAEVGADVDRLKRGFGALRKGLHQLTPERVRYLAPGGTFGGMALFDIEEDTLYWLRQRRLLSAKRWADTRAALDAVDRPLLLGGIPRTATFSALTGQDYEQMAGPFDLLFPKHYYWHRGFDGLYGTVARWVQRLCQWNERLTEADALLVVENLFGLQLPGVHSLLDLELGFPQEFFDNVVTSETQRALAAVGGDADRLIFWVSTGRAPHAGDAMTARDLRGILAASEAAGASRFLFHPDPRLAASEWRVLSSMCGTAWEETPGGWFPGAEDPTNTYSGDRKPSEPD